MDASKTMLKITKIKSHVGYRSDVKDVLHALGLRKIGQTVSHRDTPQIRGMINKVTFLLKVESGS